MGIHRYIQSTFTAFYILPWQGLSRLLASQLEARLLGSNWLPRLPGSLRLPLEGSRSLTATGLAQLLCGRFGGIRSLPSCSSASSPSSVLFARLLRISRLI